MGFGDRLKGLRDQAQHTVAENKDKIQDTLQTVGEAANARTHGKYADKIARVGERVSGGVEKFAGAEGDTSAEGDAGTGPSPSAGAASADTPAPSAPGEPSAPDEPSTPSTPPEFE